MDEMRNERFDAAYRLTGVISSIDDAREKLWWNLRVFKWSMSDCSNGPQRGSFAVLDYAKAAASMLAWCVAEEDAKKDVFCHLERETFSSVLMKRVRWQPLLHDIANSTKHARHSQQYAPQARHVVSLQADQGVDQVREHLLKLDHDVAAVEMLRLIADGELWWESVFALPSRGRVRAAIALHENYEDWHAVVDEIKAKH